MIESIHDLELRIQKDMSEATSQADMYQRATKEWDEMSDDVRDAMSTAIRKGMMGVADRMKYIVNTFHPNTEKEAVRLYMGVYGDADLPYISLILKKMHENK